MKKLICIWLDDKETNPSKDFQFIQNQFHSFRYYNNLQLCSDFLIQNQQNQIILIVTDRFVQDILSNIDSYEHIQSIYIYNSNQSIEYSHKIKGIFNDKNLLCQQIQQDLNALTEQIVGFSFLSRQDMKTNDLNRQDPTFMYFQLLKDILLNDHQEENEQQTKTELINYCQQIYSNDHETLEIVDEFKENYLSELAIYWYTRECFLYKILNKSLRFVEVDVLYKLRYFLRHLHQQISIQFQFQHEKRKSFIVYRGQHLSFDQIENFQKNLGGYLSFNQFLSTSLDRTIAEKFARRSNEAVLFEIHIDSKIDKFPFANIEHLSFHQGKLNEQEILFSMGTVFRIRHIVKEKDFYLIQLNLSHEIDEDLSRYTINLRKQIQSKNSFLSLLKLFNQIKEYYYFKNFIQIFDNQQKLISSNQITIALIHYEFASIYLSRGEYKQSLQHFRQSLSIFLTILPANHPNLSKIYNKIATIHQNQSDYSSALSVYQLSLDCLSNNPNENIPLQISTIQNIALVYFHQHHFQQSIQSHQQALDLQIKHFGENDPCLIASYHIISAIYRHLNNHKQADIYRLKAIELQEKEKKSNPDEIVNNSLINGAYCYSQGDYEKALDQFQNALDIAKQYYLPNNPIFSLAYEKISEISYKQKSYQQALISQKKCLDIQLNSLSIDHPQIAKSYFYISKDYTHLCQYTQALDYAFKSIQQLNKSKDNTSQLLSTYNQHIGFIYYQQNDYQNSLVYYQKSLDLSNKEDSSLIIIYYQIANIYNKLKDYHQAISFYEKTLKIQLKILTNHPKAIATTYMNLSTVYLKLKQFDRAFHSANQAYQLLLTILPKNNQEIIQIRAFLHSIQLLRLNK